MSQLVHDRNLAGKFRELAQEWRDRAEDFDQHGCEQVALTYGKVAEEVVRMLDGWDDEYLSVKQAAAESGYSEEYLRRLVRNGNIDARAKERSKGRTQVRRADLPTRSRLATRGGAGSRAPDYDPVEDARGIAQQLGGHHG